MCTIAAGLGVIGAVAQFAGQQQATDEYNAQAAAAHRDAAIAATYKYKDAHSRYVWDVRDLNQKGFKAALNAREEQAKGIASSGAMGIAPGSNTLENLIAQSRQIAANNEANVSDKRDQAKDSLINTDQSIQAEAQQRINSVPFKSGPNPLGLMLGIANAAVGGGSPSIPSSGAAVPSFGGSSPGVNTGFYTNSANLSLNNNYW